MPQETFAALDEGTQFTLQNSGNGEAELLSVMAPPAGKWQGHPGFKGGIKVAEREKQPVIIHRFGSRLNTHVHFPCCVVDGVVEAVASSAAANSASIDDDSAQATDPTAPPQGVVFHPAIGGWTPPRSRKCRQTRAGASCAHLCAVWPDRCR